MGMNDHLLLTGKVIFLFSRYDRAENEGAARGDIIARPGLDSAGRRAVAGRHCNYGYSGEYKCFVWDGAVEHRLLDYQDLFPRGLNKYAQQSEKRQVEEIMEEIIKANKGVMTHTSLTGPRGGKNCARLEDPYVPVNSEEGE